MKATFAVLTVLVLLFTASSISAQVREVVTVEVVDVPVYVFHAGKPITNLTKDDFTLLVNGKRQQIDYFDKIDFEAPARPAAITTPAVLASAVSPIRDPRDRRLFLLLFDLAYNRPAALARAQNAAVAMVDHAQPADFFAVATYSLRGAGFVIPFTRDHDVIRRAVLKLSPSSAHDSLAISITDAERQTTEAWSPIQGLAGHSGDDPVPEILALGKQEEEQRAMNVAQAQLEEFSALAARLSELDGYKHVILLSEGFDNSLFYKNGGPDPVMMRALRTMAQSFHAAGALFDTVDLGVIGIAMSDPTVRQPAQWQTSPSTSLSSVSGVPPPYSTISDTFKNETLHMFAVETGGQFIHWTNNITGALADLSTTSGAGYRLGFKPLNASKGYNTIDVKVKNVPSGATISFRKGFSWPNEPAKDVDSLRLADIIQNDIPQSGTPPAFSFEERPFIGVVIPARQLAKQFGAIADAELILYIFDNKGFAVDYREKKLSIAADAESDVVVRQKMVLPAGKYVAKSLLRVGKSIGFAKIAFTIPEG